MNLCVVSTYNGTKEDYLKLYESFKDDIAKYTDGFEMGFVRDGKVIIVANVTDEEKFYALFEDPRSKEFDAKFNNVDDVYKLEKNVAIPKLINGYFHDNFLKLVVKNQN